MSSYFESQKAAFSKSLASASAKMSSAAPARPSTLAPPVSPSPSVGSATSRNEATPSKRKRDANAPIYSQPENTGFGNDVLTQMTFAVEYLKRKDEPKSISDILDHLSLHNAAASHKQALAETMRGHPRIQWHPDANLSEQTWQSGSYEHRAIIPGVKTRETLLALLQRKKDAAPVIVKELKDGWPDCDPAIAQLERERRITVLRNKKDGGARLVWLDDPTRHHPVDVEFKQMWHRAKLPARDDIVRRLQAVGQKPASDDPRAAGPADAAVNRPKKKAGRRTGKVTNSHMASILKDYGHLRA